MVRERGSGKTPERVVELLAAAVKEKSILAVHKATGIGLAAIGRYLRGVGEPTTATLQKLADYFGVSIAYLRGEGPEIGSDTLHFVSGSFNNLDLPPSVLDQVGLLILNILTEGFVKLSNQEDYNTVFKDTINKYIRIINVLAPYYKHQGALGDNPYKNSPNIDSEYLLFEQLKGLLELNIAEDHADPGTEQKVSII